MAFLFFILLGIFWSFSFVAIKIIIRGLDPFWGVTFRVGFALLFLTLFYIIFKKSYHVPPKYRWPNWLNGLFMQAIPFLFLFWGEHYISAGLAGIVNGTVPLWTLLLAWMFIREDEIFSVQKFLGLCLGFLGIIIIYIPKLNLSNSHNAHWGVLAVLLMSISYGIGAVFSRKMISAKINRYGLLYQQHISSILFMVPLAFLTQGIPRISQDLVPVMVGIVYLSLVSSAIAWLMYFYLLEEWGAIRTSTITYFLPIGALMTDFLFFRTIPNISECLGAVAILCGILLTHAKRKKIVAISST